MTQIRKTPIILKDAPKKNPNKMYGSDAFFFSENIEDHYRSKGLAHRKVMDALYNAKRKKKKDDGIQIQTTGNA